MRFAMPLLFAAALLATGLDKVLAEPNLEKRSEKALDHALFLMSVQRKAAAGGEAGDIPDLMKKVREAVDVAVKSLDDSGKNPRRSPKYFKKAELKTREIARRLDSLAKSLAFDDRPPVEEAFRHVEKVHEDLLQRIMTKR